MAHPLPEFRPLRIALVSETFPPEINGVSMTLGRLVDGLARRCHAIDVVRCRRPGEAAETDTEGIRHLALPSLPIPRYQGLRLGLPARGTLRHRWAQQRPDVVHIATEGPLGHSAFAAASDLGLPISSSFHTNFDDYARHYGITPLRRWIAAMLRRFHNRCAVTMVPSSDLLGRLRDQGYERLEPLGRGVDTTLFSPQKRSVDMRRSWAAGDEDVVLLHVGRVAPEKDIPLAIAAFDRIRRHQPRTRMVVVGDGPLRRSLAARHPEVHFTGALPIGDLATAYASADLFLFPSTSETFGNVVLEAMASGLATVSFAYAAPLAHVAHGHSGLLAPFDDRVRWLSLAEQAARDADLRRKLGLAARLAAAEIGWDAVIDRFESVLRQVVDGTPFTDAGTNPSHDLHAQAG